MGWLKSNIKIENNKVVFSNEILEYFESLRNEETSEWIDKYFEVLSDTSNFNSSKFNIHHIRPCFTFKDENHKNRKETKPLADNFKENLIKLSVYNHFFAHHCLWKIFNNRDSKIVFQRMCGQGRYIDNLTEQELQEIAILKEECAKENKTEEDYAKMRELNKDKLKSYDKEKYIKNKEKKLKQVKFYTENNKEKIKKYKKEHYEENKEKILKQNKEYYENNKDKILKRNKEYYEENKDYILERNKIWNENNKDKIGEIKRNWYELNKDRIKEQTQTQEYKEKTKIRNSRKCYDPIRQIYCTYSSLQHRKNRNKELYKDIILSKCIINNNW